MVALFRRPQSDNGLDARIAELSARRVRGNAAAEPSLSEIVEPALEPILDPVADGEPAVGPAPPGESASAPAVSPGAPPPDRPSSALAAVRGRAPEAKTDAAPTGGSSPASGQLAA